MAKKLYSNELKAIVVAENFLENPRNVMREHSLRVQHFDYDCEHKLTDNGDVYGPTNTVVLKFSVSLNSPTYARTFYQNMMTNEHFQYSFLFNATFDEHQRLADYEDGMVVDGYVVSVEELFDTGSSQTENEQIRLNIEILTRSVTYLGSQEGDNFKNIFIQ